MKSLLRLSLGLLLLLGTASSAQAGTVTVTYGFTGAPVNVLGAVPVGNMSGFVTLSYSGASISAIASGPVGATLAITGGSFAVGPSLLALASIPGVALAATGAAGGAAGSLAGALGAVGGAMVGGWSGNGVCTVVATSGAGVCTGLVGTGPGVPFPFGAPIATPNNAFNGVQGAGTLAFSQVVGQLGLGTLAVPATLGGVQPTIGVEVNRVFVAPEPGTTLLLGFGAALVALGAVRRARR